MSFIENITAKLGLDLGLAPLPYRAIIFGELGVYIENVKSIKSFSPLEVSILLKKGELVIKGENLSIKNYTGFDLYVLGKVKEFFYK
ncbi:MAG: hypothetical protein E7342_02110 [Clostridiales bacterium]|nr:hypothetical protein [Clostridiales bacterium]